jgi:hypothetical protein
MSLDRPRDRCIEREVLIAFDLLLVLVLGLLLYSHLRARLGALPRPFDWLLVLLVVSALLVDVLALAAILGADLQFGFTPNRVAALGLNLILLVNLAWSAWLYGRFLRAARLISARWRSGRPTTFPSSRRGRPSSWSPSPHCSASPDACGSGDRLQDGRHRPAAHGLCTAKYFPDN